MLRIGICDDELAARDALRLSLERLLREDDGKVLYDFSSGEGVVKWLAKHSGELDLLFLDVELGGISGMEAAKQIRLRDTNLMLVFVTGYADFVFDGYAVGAMDYLVKPIKEDKLSQVLVRVQKLLECRKPQTFIVQNSEGLYRIVKKDILYLCSDRRLVKVLTRDREFSFYGKLDEVESSLGSGFVRIHQRYLVRAEAVLKIEKNNVTISDTRLPISRALQKSAMTALARNMIGGDIQW
ncbi:putative two-component response regulator [Oscillibacter valericigenes Sjm18-20]|nr:putative two-component response regulator [Oscillibacter valericigenes Sjm18-20]